ncbi:MAG: CotH kinase family protein [Lachnospiraceae bacterium]|nr:CotH kinase family protein [Lachnospiraceae bacterium]
MRKHRYFTLKPLLCAVAASMLLLSVAGCNSGDKPNQPADSSQPGITGTVDKGPLTSAPNASHENTPDNVDVPEDDTKLLPQFSAEGGFYDNGFTLTLSSEQGNTIYYTLDGTDPRTSSSAKEYKKGIFLYNNTDEPNVYSAVTEISLGGYNPPQFNVDKGMTVRAVVKTPEGEFGDIITNSYFIGKDTPYYSEMKVISMVTDGDYIFDNDTGIYMIGSKYYEWLNSEDYVPYDAGDVLNVTNYNTGGRETEVPVSIQVFEDGKAVFSADVGTRISGNWSRAHAQKSFRLYARKEYGDGKMNYAFFDGLTDANGELIESFDKVTLRNGGNDYQELHFRDALIHDLAKNLACDIMAAEPCILFVNGEFWGFYMIREKTDGEYIEARYGIPKEDVAVVKNGEIEEGTDEDLEEFYEFCSWAVSADMTNEENYQKFCEAVDIQSFMDYMTVETYVNNNDWANGGSNNWQVWHSRTVNPDLPKADGKWRFILYDTEFSTGLYGSEGTQYRYDLLNQMSVGGGAFNYPDILRNLCRNDAFRQKFYDNYIHIMDTVFHPDTVCEKIDTYAAAYGEVTKATFFRFGLDWAAWNYDNEVEEFKNYFRSRPKYAKRYLDTFCDVKSDDMSSFSKNQIPEVSTWTYYGDDATFRIDSTDNSFHASVPEKLSHSWKRQALAGDIELVQGGEYCLTFEASSTDSSTPKLLFGLEEGWSEPQAWVSEIPLTPELTSYEYRFVMNEFIEEGWKFCINLGKCTGDLIFKNVSLTRIR